MSIFMQYPGVQGECSDQQHRGWLDIDQLSWSVSRKITSHSSTRDDRESSNAEIGDLTVTRRADSATPALFIESCCGRGKEVTIRLTKTGAGSGADVYVEYILKNCLISDYVVAASAQHGQRPMERLTISFVGLDVRYTPYDEDGKALAALAVGFDTSRNQKA